MSRSTAIAACAIVLLSPAILSSQQTQNGGAQTGQLAQPSSAVYNRMRRAAQSQQPTTQAQQFPSPQQQFPPDQSAPASPLGRTPIRFPHPTLPVSQAVAQPQANPAPAAQNPSPTVQQQPQAPSGPALEPANPPRVSFVGGQLTVAAENSTLTDILAAVQNVTHARLEGTPPDSERVFGQFGPGTPRQVLNSLLNGSRYDFILAGAIDDPGGVERIMLSPHGGAPAGGAVSSQPVMARQGAPTPGQEDDDNEGVVQPEGQQQVPQPPLTFEQGQAPGQQQPQVKTPEQLLQELQRLRLQQQQQQQTQPPPNSNPR